MCSISHVWCRNLMKHCEHFICFGSPACQYCVTAVSKDNETRNLAYVLLEITDKKMKKQNCRIIGHQKWGLDIIWLNIAHRVGPASKLQKVVQHCLWSSFQHLQRWSRHHSSCGEPVTMFQQSLHTPRNSVLISSADLANFWKYEGEISNRRTYGMLLLRKTLGMNEWQNFVYLQLDGGLILEFHLPVSLNISLNTTLNPHSPPYHEVWKKKLKINSY